MDGYLIYEISALVALSLINALILCYKAIKRNDRSLYASAIPRLLLSAVVGSYIFTGSLADVNIIHLLMVVVFLTDFIINIFYLASRKYLDAIKVNQLTKALHDLGDKYSAIVENALISFYVFDAYGIIEYANPKLCELTGYSKAELVGKQVLTLIPKKYHKRVKENIELRISGKEKAICYDIELIHKNGAVIPVKVFGTRTENGHPTITGNIIELTSTGECK